MKIIKTFSICSTVTVLPGSPVLESTFQLRSKIEELGETLTLLVVIPSLDVKCDTDWVRMRTSQPRRDPDKGPVSGVNPFPE